MKRLARPADAENGRRHRLRKSDVTSDVADARRRPHWAARGKRSNLKARRHGQSSDSNTLDRDRTCNLQLRRLTLYPIELRGRMQIRAAAHQRVPAHEPAFLESTSRPSRKTAGRSFGTRSGGLDANRPATRGSPRCMTPVDGRGAPTSACDADAPRGGPAHADLRNSASPRRRRCGGATDRCGSSIRTVVGVSSASTDIAARMPRIRWACAT